MRTKLVGIWLSLALLGCGGDDSCRCVGDVPQGHLDIACGQTSCIGGVGYACAGSQQTQLSATACAAGAVPSPSPSSCTFMVMACNAPSDCCTGGCFEGECCVPQGGACRFDLECCGTLDSGKGARCVAGACASCQAYGSQCVADADCCGQLKCSSGFCRMAADSCVTSCLSDTDCCTGYTCQALPQVGLTCAPGKSCAQDFGSCSTDGDCCSGLTCQSHECRPPCANANEGCGPSKVCCGTLSCMGGTCQTPAPTCKTSGSCGGDSDCCTNYHYGCNVGTCCIALGGDCSAFGSGCCTGTQCISEFGNPASCCVPSLGTCAQDGDCCQGTAASRSCVNHKCCAQKDSICGSGTECCSGMCGANGLCQ
jgi:hypothetical protein